MVVQVPTMTVEAFWETVANLPEDAVYELVEERLVTIPPPSKLHAKIVTLIATFLNVYALQKQLGTVLAEGGYTFVAKRSP